jgi:uncharacterized membrane protein YdjX (TVP38/TMEM64 family)
MYKGFVIKKTKSTYFRLILILIIFLMFYFIGQYSGVRESISIEIIGEHFKNNLLFGFLIFCILLTLGNLLYIPGLLFLAAAVIALGKGMGGMVTYVAAVTSCCISYFAVNFVGGGLLREFDSKIAQNIFLNLDKKPIGSVVVLRLIFQTAPALNYALALSDLKLKNYLIGTILGLPIAIALYCIFFDELAKILF